MLMTINYIYKAGNQIKNIENELYMEAGIASDWYKENLLKPNYKKYQSMKLSPHLLKLNASSHDDFALRIDDHEIASSDSLKILGVNFDNTIDFSKHISDICIKCSQKVGVIMRLRKLIPTTAKLQLYKSAILSHLTYCHLVWNFCKASDRKKLERVQEKALKAVFNKKQSYL